LLLRFGFFTATFPFRADGLAGLQVDQPAFDVRTVRRYSFAFSAHA
jgi:hypothetical protein